jgi:hypothetical protein
LGATFELIGGFRLNFYGGDDVDGVIDSILLNLVASINPKWRTFNVLRLAQLMNTDLWIWIKVCKELMALNITWTT